MSSGTVIVQDALRLIGAHSLASPASPESLAVGFRNLGGLFHMWLTRNIDLSISPLEDIGDELNEPPDSYSAITSNLAVMLAPNFDNGRNIVSQALSALASTEFEYIKSAYWNGTIPDKVVSATLPRGQGARFWWTDSTFFGGGAVLNDNTSD